MRPLPPDICDPSRVPLEQGLSLARQRSAERPTYDLQISRFLSDYMGSETIDPRVIERSIDILSEIAPAARLLAVLRFAMESDNALFRSKAALSLGRKVESLPLLQKLVSDNDPRVRANTIEALWGRRTRDIEAVFRQALGDVHHRVAANAAYGLYLIGEAKHVEYLVALAGHALPGHRGAAAWLVGKIGDIRNAHHLKPLLVDPNEVVRKAAFQAIAAIRTAKSGP